jgi:hypothetical protein
MDSKFIPRSIFLIVVAIILGGPTVFLDLKHEIDDHFQHREISICVGPWNVRGWIPYHMRVNKKKCYLPPYEDPWKYIKNYDPNDSKHMAIVLDSLGLEKEE